jgi:hypothetical protein
MARVMRWLLTPQPTLGVCTAPVDRARLVKAVQHVTVSADRCVYRDSPACVLPLVMQTEQICAVAFVLSPILTCMCCTLCCAAVCAAGSGIPDGSSDLSKCSACSCGSYSTGIACFYTRSPSKAPPACIVLRCCKLQCALLDLASQTAPPTSPNVALAHAAATPLAPQPPAAPAPAHPSTTTLVTHTSAAA